MRTRSLWLSLLGLCIGLFVACSADPPVVSVGDAYTPYSAAGRNPYSGIHNKGSDTRADTWKQQYGRTVTSTGPSTASLNGNPMIRSPRPPLRAVCKSIITLSSGEGQKGLPLL